MYCEHGRAIIYVGIEEPGRPTMVFRATPGGDARLDSDF
jgi:hypothetical protein